MDLLSTRITEDSAAPIVPSSLRKESALGGLVVRKYRWVLAWWAKLLLLVVGITLTVGMVLGAYPFLAITQHVNADILVVEGWVHPYAIHAAVDEFRKGRYQRIFTTGGPVVGKGGYINDFQTSASVGADLLRQEGIPNEVLQMVPTRVIGRDRTYSSAVALNDWFRKNKMQVQSLNVLTEGAHARRSRLLFGKALGPDAEVGVIAVPSPDFDARHWWYYSEGVENVVEEGLGYLYAKFFFYPRERDSALRSDAAGDRGTSATSAPVD